MSINVVLDASVYVDLFTSRSPERVRVAEEAIRVIEGVKARVHAPRLLLIELAGVLGRFLPKSEVDEALTKVKESTELVSEELLYEHAFEVAKSTTCRAIDAYYIAASKLRGAILATHDKVQARNARLADVKAFYLLEELDSFKEFIAAALI